MSTALGAIRVAIAVWTERDRPGRLTDLLDEAFDHLTHGLTGPLPTAPAGNLTTVP